MRIKISVVGYSGFSFLQSRKAGGEIVPGEVSQVYIEFSKMDEKICGELTVAMG